MNLREIIGNLEQAVSFIEWAAKHHPDQESRSSARALASDLRLDIASLGFLEERILDVWGQELRETPTPKARELAKCVLKGL